MISKCPAAAVLSVRQTIPAEHHSMLLINEARQRRGHEEGGTTWQNMAPGILRLSLFLKDTPDFSLKACFLYGQCSAAPACRNLPEILALLLWNLEVLFYEEPFPLLHWREEHKAKSNKALIHCLSTLSHTPPCLRMHTQTHFSKSLVRTQASTAPGNERRKGPHNCHLSIFIKNPP